LIGSLATPNGTWSSLRIESAVPIRKSAGGTSTSGFSPRSDTSSPESCWYELHSRTRSREAIRRAVEEYRAARRAWISASGHAEAVYADDLSFGAEQRLRGRWGDRLAAIDADLGDMEAQRSAAETSPAGTDDVTRQVELAASPTLDIDFIHSPPTQFDAEADVRLDARIRGSAAAAIRRVTVRYRAMNQSRSYETRDMERVGDRLTATIPGNELDHDYPLAYAFVMFDGRRHAWRHPGIGAELTSQPYFVIRPARDV
jgi:hypothetical protein